MPSPTINSPAATTIFAPRRSASLADPGPAATSPPATGSVRRPASNAEYAGGEQQAGEDEHVGVDDPLELRGRRLQVDRQGRKGDVEDRVVEADHDQREAQHPERPPAAGK